MSDGGQTLLDVIEEDPNVLDSFFNVEGSYTHQNLESPGFDNATAISESTFTSTSLESLGFESLAEPFRSGNSVLQQVINSNHTSAAQCVGNGGQQLYSQNNDLLQNTQNVGLVSHITPLSHDNRQRASCSHADSDQSALQQLLSTSNTLTSQTQQLHLNPNQVLPSNLVHSQIGNQNQLMQQTQNQRSHQHLLPLDVDQNIELGSNLMHASDSAAAIFNNRNSSIQSCSQVLAREVIHSDATINSSPKVNSNVSTSVGVPGIGKVQLISGANHVLQQNMFSSGAQIAGHVIPGTSLISGNQVLPTSSIIPRGQVFQNNNLQGAQILTNVINNSQVVTSLGSINHQSHLLYASTQNLTSTPQTTMTITSPSTSIGALNMLPSNVMGSQVSLHTNTTPVSSRTSTASQAVVIQKSSCTIQSVQSPSFVTQAPTITLDGVPSGVLSNMSMGARMPSHNLALNQVSLPVSSPISSGTKQVASGSQVFIVGAQNSKPTVAHTAPVPIQPKPQILPKPSNVRQPTTPPAVKTLIGSRPTAPTNQQAIVIGPGQQQAMLGQQPLGNILLNQNVFGTNSFLVPQANAPPLYFKLGPSTTGNQTILAAPSTIFNNKLPQQTIVLPNGGQTQPLLIQPGLASPMPTGNIFGAASAGRAQPPIFRYVTNPAPLQLQYQGGNTLLAIPTQHPTLNLSSVLGVTTPGNVRAISPQVGQAPFQLAPINTVPNTNLGGIQISNYQAPSTQPVQVNTAPLVSTSISGGIPQAILLKNNPVASTSTNNMPISSMKNLNNEKSRRTPIKKKKKVTEVRDDTTLININDILKQSGIDNDMMFDESEFGVSVENSSNTVTTPEQTISISNVATTNSFSSRLIPTTNSFTNPINTSLPGMATNLFLTMDQEGKLIVSQQEFGKLSGMLPSQQTPVNNLQMPTMQLWNAGNNCNSSGETVLLGGSNDRGQGSLTEKCQQTSQYLTITNTNGSQSLVKIDGTPVSQVASPVMIKEVSENKNVISNNILLNPSNQKLTKSPIISNEAHSSGVNEQSQNIVGIPKVIPDAKSKNNQIMPTSTLFTPGRNNSIIQRKSFSAIEVESENVTRTATVMPLTPVNTYQHKYVESVKPPIFAEKTNKTKKSGRRKKKDEPVEMQNRVVSHGAERVTLMGSTPNTSQVRSDNTPGASMPSLSFAMSPVSAASDSISKVTTNSVSATHTGVDTKVIATSALPSTGNYGIGLRPQNQIQSRPRSSSHTIQFMLSAKNKMILKKVGAQIQDLKSRPSLTAHEKTLTAKLLAEYNKIFSLARPVPPANVMQSPNELHNDVSVAVKLIPTSQTLPVSAAPALPSHSSLTNQTVKTRYSTVAQPNGITDKADDKGNYISQLKVNSISSAEVLSPSKIISSPQKNSVVPHAQNVSAQLGNSLDQGRLAGIQPSPAAALCPQTIPTSSHSLFSKPLTTRDQLFDIQMKTDENGSLNPDYNTPFKNRTDACKRLIRYHTFNTPEPTTLAFTEEDDKFVSQSDTCLRKRVAMEHKYQSLLMKDNMQTTPSAEQVMMLRLVNQEEKFMLEMMKTKACSEQGINMNLPIDQPIGSSFLDTKPWEVTWPKEKVFIRNVVTGSLRNVKKVHKNSMPDRPESEEPPLQIFVDEESTQSNESISQIAKKIGMNHFTSSDSDTRSPFMPPTDSDPCGSASNNVPWNVLSQLRNSSEFEPVTNGIEIMTSSSDSVQAWPLDDEHDGCDVRRVRGRKRKSHKSKYHDRNPPIKLLLKIKEKDGEYSCSSPPDLRIANAIVQKKAKRRRIHTESAGSPVIRPNHEDSLGLRNKDVNVDYSRLHSSDNYNRYL